VRAATETTSVAIVGAGFGGIGLGIRLRQAGIESFTILDRADGVGGVWRDNTYPGLTCDIPSHLYSFSFEPNYEWTRRFARQPEILTYLERCVDKHRLRDRLRLSTEVTAARFDSGSGKWRVELGDGGAIEADVLVTATGQLSQPAYPSIPGMRDFRGRLFHSARWDHEYDLTGKRVGVIGTGATAIQLVPEIAPGVEHLDIFQRSAPWVVPKPDRPYRPRERALYRRLPWIQALSRLRIYLFYELLSLGFSGRRWLHRPLERSYESRLRSEVSNPELRARLRPDYPLGCKRILVSDDWLATLTRPNVEVVSDAIAEIVPDGVVTDCGELRELDAIILATGFASRDFLAPMAVTGIDGMDLNEAWSEGAEAYLGLAVSGFPNMFMLYGPNTNLGAGSVVYMLESQIRYVVGAMLELQRNAARYLDVRRDVHDRFSAEMQQRLAGTVWTAGCSNWYVTESGRVTNNWPGVAYEYRRRTRDFQIDDYRVAQPLIESSAGARSA
jgi:cation diffusion facilitator CzcD-associated flavoprotein CzcO